MSIAIDIGTRNIHLVSGQARGDRIFIDRMVIDPIPSGLVQDGIIREYSGLELAMKNMFDKYKIKGRDCIITINGNHIYTREMDVPKTAPKVMANVVTFEVQNATNGNKDIYVEFVASKQQNPEKPNMLHVRASAIQSDYILDYGKLIKNLKMKPVAMDIHPNAITKLMNCREINDVQTKDRNIMLVDIGFVTSTAYVISNGEIAYTRIIPSGTIDLDRYCINFNSNEKPENHISIEKINLSLSNLRMNQSLGDAIRPLVMSLTDGVNRIQQFLSGRILGNKVETIYIYGFGSTFEGFEETLKESMKMNVERVKKLSGVNFPEGTDPAPYLNAIGALIRLKG
jgi:type IV pilus assembly protein PilM